MTRIEEEIMNRIKEAIKRIDEAGFFPDLKNEFTGQIVIKTQTKTFVYYANTGKVVGHDNGRGITFLIGLLKETQNETDNS